MKLQIAAPQMRLSFGDEGLPLGALSGVAELVGAALTEHGLIDCAAECRVTNVGRTLYLVAPGGAVVWSHELPKAVA